jgi:hypothetical protein
MSGLSVARGSAGVQSDSWGARAREWCLMEAQMRPLYETVLERVGIGHGTELLDAGWSRRRRPAVEGPPPAGGGVPGGVGN